MIVFCFIVVKNNSNDKQPRLQTKVFLNEKFSNLQNGKVLEHSLFKEISLINQHDDSRRSVKETARTHTSTNPFQQNKSFGNVQPIEENIISGKRQIPISTIPNLQNLYINQNIKPHPMYGTLVNNLVDRKEIASNESNVAATSREVPIASIPTSQNSTICLMTDRPLTIKESVPTNKNETKKTCPSRGKYQQNLYTNKF